MAAHPAVQIYIRTAFRAKGTIGLHRLRFFAYRTVGHRGSLLAIALAALGPLAHGFGQAHHIAPTRHLDHAKL